MTEPNRPPAAGLNRQQQRDLARREALAYYGRSTTPSTPVEHPATIRKAA